MRLAAMVVLGVFTLCTAVSAQQKPVQQHEGVWGGFGLGGGIDISEGDLWGVSASGRLGGTLNQRVLLGGESSGWVGSRRGVDLARGNVSAVILFYPGARGGLFFKGGVGFAYVTTSRSESGTIGGVFYVNTVSRSTGGFGATAGVGRDVRLGHNIYLVPEVDWFLQAVGSEDAYFGIPATVNIISLTLGLVWH